MSIGSMRVSLSLSTQPINERRLTYLFGVAVVLHALIDPALTYYVGTVGDIGYETNPIIREAMAQGAVALIAIHLLLIVESSLLYGGLLYLIRRAEPPIAQRLAALLRIGCFALILWGLGLVGWNLWIMVG